MWMPAGITRHVRRLRGDAILALLAREASGTLIIKICGTGITFGTHILLARLLGEGSYGIYVYLLTWMNVLSLASQLGLDATSLRFVAAYNGRAEWGLLWGFLKHSRQLVLLVSVGVALGTAGIVFLLRGRLPGELRAAFWVMCLVLPVNVLLQVQGASLQALKQVVLSMAMEELLRRLLLVGGVLLLVGLLQWEATAAQVFTVNLVATCGTLGLVVWYLRLALPAQVRRAVAQYRIREWDGVALSLLIVSGFHVLLNQTDVLLVGMLRGTTEAGIYAAASRVAALLIFGLTAVNAIAAPMISELYGQGRLEELQRMVTFAARSVLIFSLPIGIGVIVWGKPILRLFGEAFMQGYSVLVILVIGQLVNTFAGSVGNLMTMTGNQIVVVRVLGVGAALNIILNALLIPLWGIAGAAMATAMTTAGWNIVLIYYVWKCLGLRSTALS